ncbi:MAG: hypothetical protein M3512_03900 [Bacteroidota bacterium]|nr:hypothetical protein [Bacteroidota bacterium]
MGQIGKLSIEEGFEFGFMRISEASTPEAADVQSRADVIQDVIDRMVARNFSKEYLEDLAKLNRKYPVEYRLVNGVRIY